MNIYKSIGLVDFSHMLVVNYKALGKIQGPNDAENQTMVQLAGIRESCERVVICLDSKPYKRSDVYPPYKAQREREPELVAMWKRCVERLALDGYQTARAPGAEADDVIATLARLYCDAVEGYGCTDVRIYGTDKDCLQCVNEHVRCFAYTGHGEWEIRDFGWVTRKWEVPPKDMALMLAICGDTSDNIPGISGIGPKIAAKLVNAYKNPEGMAVAMAAAVEAAKVTGKLPAFWKNYAQGCASLPLWLKLTTLDTNVELDKHPLKYLEKLEMKPLVKEPERGTDEYDLEYAESEHLDPLIDREVDWDTVAAETAEREREELRLAVATTLNERERAELAAALPVEPVKPEPRIGKDPKADEHLAQAARERSKEQVDADNAKEASRVRPDGRTQGEAMEQAKMRMADLPPGSRGERMSEAESNAEWAAINQGLDRHGQPRPKAPDAPTAASSGPPAAESAGSHRAGADPKAAPPATPEQKSAPAVSAPASNGAAEVVPKTQGPQEQIIPVQAPSWALSTQPISALQAFQIAVKLHNSRRFLEKHDNPEQIAAVILRGRELGIGMMTSIEAFHVIRGKVCASAQLISALSEKDPNHDYTMLVELDEQHAIVEIKHKRQPRPVRWSYTIEEAAALGLLAPSRKTGEPSMWVKRPKTMLAKTAQVIGHRFMFPGASLGLHPLETEVELQEHVDRDD